MIGQREFNALCESFNAEYLASKKNLGKLGALSSRLIEPIEGVIAEVPSIECRRGCSHCCHLRVVAYPHEIVSIYLFLTQKLSKERLKEVKARAEQQYEVVRSMSIDEHFTNNVECPMLWEGACLIHAVRPIACAGYHSASEASCRNSFKHPEVVGVEAGGIPMISGVKQEQELQNTVAAQVIRAHGDDDEQYELIRGLYKVFENPKKIQQWKNGRKLFK